MSAAATDGRPEEAPESCPGTQSDNAGKSSACAGCPNQKICASGQPKQADPAVAEVKWRLAGVKRKIIVLSGKGGVGKSTVTATLARGLAVDKLRQVAVLDVDICGPSLPRILGAQNEQVYQSGSGWSPVYVDDNLALMSVGFLLQSEDDAVIWRGPRKTGLVKQFLKDVDWGDVDYLLIDTPPGTSDEHLSLVQYLAQAQVDGAIIVTTPQEVAILDVRKEIDFCRKVNLPILGIVENMSGFVCPKCSTESQIFPPTTGGGRQLAEDTQVKFLGQVPLDPRIGRLCDEGKCLFTDFPQSNIASAYNSIVQEVVDLCDKNDNKNE